MFGGKFEGDRFDPRTWHPQTPTTAYMELRDDDAFWAARRVSAFTDDMIRAVVHTGEFSDAAAEQHLADVLIKRRDKIAQIYLTAVRRRARSPDLVTRNSTSPAFFLLASRRGGEPCFRLATIEFKAVRRRSPRSR